jgi:hypothetical protein
MLPQLRRLLPAALLLAVSLSSAAAPDARTWTYQYLLATAKTERELAPITEHIVKDASLHGTDIMDFAAEVLLARTSDGSFPLQNKLRLIRVLGAAGSPRYNTVLLRVSDQLKNEDVLTEARAATYRKKHPVAEPYLPGSTDIESIVAEVDAAALAARPTTAQGEHLSKFPGGTFDQLFEWAGRPHQIVSGQTRVSDGILIHIKIQRVTFFYRGVGRVVYGYNGNKKVWLFQAVVADPLAFEQEFSYRDRARDLGLPDEPTLEMIQLVSGYTASIKSVVEKNYQRQTRPLEFMDTAAEILVTQFATADDPVKVDMYAWICRLLTMHGGRRYAAILAQVAKGTDDSKLRRFATLPIEKTNEVPAEPYVPGTISLAAQRAKYPSLYPESTFQSGRL